MNDSLIISLFCQKVYKRFSTNRCDSPQVTNLDSPQAINYSTIIKTINADAKKLTDQFGLLNKSFRDIKKDFANGLGAKNSLFQTSISKTDYQALQKFNSAIKITNDGLTKSQRINKAWNENMTGCSIAAKRMGNDLVTGKKNIQDVSNAMDTASKSTKTLGIAMNVMVNVGFMLAITAITKVISELAQAQENAVEAAKEATETYKSELDSIADYKKRLSELHEELKSGNLSYEETKSKRTELMSIQDELIEKFGTEKDAIESVSDAINGQVDALDELNEKSYRDWLAKADEQTFWNKLLPGGKSGLDQAIDYMETEKTVSFMDMQNANLSDELQAIQKEIDDTIQAKYNLDKTFAMFNVTGTPDEIRTQLENIRQDYADISEEVFTRKELPSDMWEEYRKETTDSINEVITNLDKDLEKHQDTYRTYIEGLTKYDSEYSDEYANIIQKRAELESTQLTGNEEDIKKAKQEFMNAINESITASESDENIKKYFESLYPELQAEFANWKFEFDLEANEDNINDIAKEIAEKYTATDLLDMIDEDSVIIADSAFNSLIDKAIEYGVCTDKSAEEVQKLIDLLIELGIVQDNVQGSTSNNETDIPLLSISSTIDQLNTRLKPAFDSLKSAYQSIFTADGFDLNAVDIPLLQSIQSSIEELNNLEGADISIDSKTFEDFAKTLTDINTTEFQAQQAFNDLASSIFCASGSTEGMTNETLKLVEQLLESLGVANAAAVAEQALAKSKACTVLAAHDLTDATEAEYLAILSEGKAAGLTRQQIYNLAAAEIAFGQNTLNTEQKVTQLRNLAVAYGDTASAALATAIANDLASGHTDVDSAINDLMLQINAGIPKTNIDFSGFKETAGSAASAAGDAYVEAFEDAVSKLDDLKEAGIITEKDYLDRYRTLYEKYYGSLKQYAKEYAAAQKTYLSGMLSLYNSAISASEKLLDSRIDALEKEKEQALNALEEERDARLEAIDAEKEQLNLQIEAIEKQIDAKNKEIDAINDAADARQREINLQKAQYELERMQNQRTALTYSEAAGMQYVADTKGIRDAREEADDAKREILTGSMQTEIDLLEEQNDRLEEQADLLQKQADELEVIMTGLLRTLKSIMTH